MSDRTPPRRAVREVSSFRLQPEMVARLDARAAALGTTRSTLVEQFLEESLRIVEHPGIRFADGPAGRRPALVGGPDVWEIVMVLRANAGNVDEVADLLGLPVGRVQAAVRYYAAYTDEIDGWVARNDAAWEREAEIEARRRGLFA
jgi:hypothetical protein